MKKDISKLAVNYSDDNLDLVWVLKNQHPTMVWWFLFSGISLISVCFLGHSGF